MKVYTESGHTYVFSFSHGALRTFFGTKEIIVTDIENLEVGCRLTVKGYPLNIYCQPSTNKMVFTTSAIKKIED